MQLSDAFADAHARPTSADANGHLAMLLQTYKQFNAADVMYQRARALAPKQFRWTYLHGIVLIATGKPDAAIDAFEAAVALRGDYILARVRLAELLADRGDQARAGQLYDELMSSGTPPSEAYFSHGKFLLQTGRADQAIASFKETLRRSGNLGVAHYQLGMAYRDKGQTELAARHLSLAKQYQGYSADSSDRVLNQLLPLNLSEQPFVHRAKILAESGRFAEARKFIEMALERNPDSVAAHASMIGMAAKEGDFSGADEHFEKAVAIDPDNAKIWFNLGMARIAEQRWVEAGRAFDRSRALDDTDANTFVQLALLAKRDGDDFVAERHLRSAVDLDPEQPIANWLLGELLSDSDRSEEALVYLGRAVAMEHRLGPLMLATLSQAQARSGHFDQAAATLARARADAHAHEDRSMNKKIEAVARELQQLRASDALDES